MIWIPVACIILILAGFAYYFAWLYSAAKQFNKEARGALKGAHLHLQAAQRYMDQAKAYADYGDARLATAEKISQDTAKLLAANLPVDESEGESFEPHFMMINNMTEPWDDRWPDLED